MPGAQSALLAVNGLYLLSGMSVIKGERPFSGKEIDKAAPAL